MNIFSRLLPFLAIGLLSCGGDSNECSRASDCFKGEVCAQGVCLEESDLSNNPNNPDPSNNPDDPNPSNPTGNNNGPTQPGVNNTTPTLPDLACVVDPLTTSCSDPDDVDDAFPTSFTNSTNGCRVRDEFTPMDETRSEVLCAREVKDRFTQLYVGCDSKSYVMELTFEPKVECDPSVFRVNAYIDGKDCETPSDEIRCEQLPNGGMKITAIVNPNSSVSSASFTVEALFTNAIQFEYDLRWVMRE